MGYFYCQGNPFVSARNSSAAWRVNFLRTISKKMVQCPQRMESMNKSQFTAQLVAERAALSCQIDAAMGRQPADLVLKNATYVNVFTGDLRRGDIAITDGQIVGIGKYNGDTEIDVAGKIIVPGLIDSHIHLESSLVTPAEFAKAVLPHGTTTVITDPHEIANVMGTAGIEYMLQAASGLPLDVFFMLPSCVPATPHDESGATLSYRDIEPFYAHPRVLGLAEMMNYVGVMAADGHVLDKIAAAKIHSRRVDGHAPDLDGNGLNAYIAAGISSDHECYELKNAMAKLERGQHIMIREGTAAQNLDALRPLLNKKYGGRCMLCTDDKHPNDLLKKGHIDYIIRRAIAAGADTMATIRAATYNAAQYFGLADKGAIAPGFQADMLVVNNLQDFKIEQVFKNGELCCKSGKVKAFKRPVVSTELDRAAKNTMHVKRVTAKDFAVSGPLGVIGLVPGELLTSNLGTAAAVDVKKDILKIATIERHRNTGHIGVGYVHGYGLKSGAVATSVAHDSHNIVVAGTNDKDMACAVNQIIRDRGGIVVVRDGRVISRLALPVAGILSADTLENVNRDLEAAKRTAVKMGTRAGIDPFMTLGFMCLPVIPKLRIMTRGVFNVDTQQYVCPTVGASGRVR